MNELALFAGAGGGILGGILLGWRTVCAVELDPYCQRILAERQNDGILEPFPIYSDIREFDGREWAGSVDVVSGGFPCTDISAAGKGSGITGSESGLWKEMARIVGEVRPRYVFVENSPALTSRGLGTVLSDLAEMDFDAEVGVLGAHHVGAPHKRDRIWILACHPDRYRESARSVDDEAPRMQGNSNVADAAIEGLEIGRRAGESTCSKSEFSGWWESEPDVGRVAHGVASRVDRLRAIGNGQVPAVVALAFRTLHERLREGGS